MFWSISLGMEKCLPLVLVEKWARWGRGSTIRHIALVQNVFVFVHEFCSGGVLPDVSLASAVPPGLSASRFLSCWVAPGLGIGQVV